MAASRCRPAARTKDGPKRRSRSPSRVSRSRRRSTRASCIDGLAAVGAGTARLLFTSSNKPVVIRPVSGGGAASEVDYTYLIMPVRLPG